MTKALSSLSFSVLSMVVIFTSCINDSKSKPEPFNLDSVPVTDCIITDTLSHIPIKSKYEQMLDSLDLIDIKSLDTGIVIDIKYSTVDNFMHKDLYGDFDKCYLEKETAHKLVEAQKAIKAIDNNLSLIVFDAVRPRSIQKEMWEDSDLSEDDKRKFLANPDKISLHNFGTAVDVSIIMSDGTLLDMGTEFDHSGELAYPSLEEYFMEKGILGINQVQNRKILRKCMLNAGFIYNKYEWWHFNSCRRIEALDKYAIIENFSHYKLPQKQQSPRVDSAIVIFKVQIAASGKRLSTSDKLFSNETPSEYRHQGMYKYTLGDFTNLQEAYEYRDSLRTEGFKQAFIVCFNNGERIHIQEAIRLLQ